VPTPLHAHHSCLRIAVKSNAHSRFPSLWKLLLLIVCYFCPLWPVIYECALSHMSVVSVLPR